MEIIKMPDNEKCFVKNLILSEIENFKAGIMNSIDEFYLSYDGKSFLAKQTIMQILSDVHVGLTKLSEEI
jgi:hypothetical protein